jgi:serine/threonine protein kinase
MQLERHMIGLPEQKKHELRRVLEHEENSIQKETRKKISVSDFESLAVIGRGAFGEVRLARRTGKKDDPQTGQIFALKSMKKEMMVVKNQVHHVKAERDALSKADDANRWLTLLSYSFFDESHIYMAMEFMPGGDLMSLLIKEDTFSEDVTKFFMAEAAQAISSVHALGYIHRDIKPDNMLLSANGHLKLTDLGLCKKVGEVSPTDEPEVVLEMLKRQGQEGMGSDWNATQVGSFSSSPGAPGLSKHRSADDAMAMSIDDGIGVGNGGPVNPRDAKTRREVSCCCVVEEYECCDRVWYRNRNGTSSLT